MSVRVSIAPFTKKGSKKSAALHIHQSTFGAPLAPVAPLAPEALLAPAAPQALLAPQPPLAPVAPNLSPMTLLILLSASARARVVAAHLRFVTFHLLHDSVATGARGPRGRLAW